MHTYPFFKRIFHDFCLNLFCGKSNGENTRWRKPVPPILIHSVSIAEMTMKELLFVILVVWLFNYCWSLEQAATSPELTQFELSCRHNEYLNGKLLAEERVNKIPSSVST